MNLLNTFHRAYNLPIFIHFEGIRPFEEGHRLGNLEINIFFIFTHLKQKNKLPMLWPSICLPFLKKISNIYRPPTLFIFNLVYVFPFYNTRNENSLHHYYFHSTMKIYMAFHMFTLDLPLYLLFTCFEFSIKSYKKVPSTLLI